VILIYKGKMGFPGEGGKWASFVCIREKILPWGRKVWKVTGGEGSEETKGKREKAEDAKN